MQAFSIRTGDAARTMTCGCESPIAADAWRINTKFWRCAGIHSEAITADPSYVIDSQVAVFRKLGESLPLIPVHQAIVQKQIARCMAEIQLHRSKADLMAGKYS